MQQRVHTILALFILSTAATPASAAESAKPTSSTEQPAKREPASKQAKKPIVSQEHLAFLALLKKHDANAALHLARAGNKGTPFLSKALKHGKRPAALAAWALTQHPCPSLEPDLRPLLKRPNQVAGYWAARALGKLARPESVDALTALLPDKPNAYWELSRRGKPHLRHKRAHWIKLPEFAPPDMPNIRVTYAAMEALGQIGGPKAERCLLQALRSPQYLIRYGAARGLATLRSKQAVPVLRHAAQADPVLIVRRAAARALDAVNGKPAPPAAKPPPMPEALLLVKTNNRTESNLGFRDSYFFPKVPWYHWGENLFLLRPVKPDGTVTNLTHLTDGAVQGPELSYDGKRVLFAMRRHVKTEGFHIYEMNVDGSGLRRLTHGNCNDVDPCYLPDGRIAFCSDRAGYREYYHQERSRVLYVMNADGSDIRQITFNPNQDYEPHVLSDGRILYSSYRFYGQDGSRAPLPNELSLQRIETVLRTVRGDGFADDLFYGAMRGSFYSPIRPMPDGLQYSGWHPRGNHIGVAVSQARELPDGRIVCVTPAGLTTVDPSLSAVDCELPVYPEIINLAGGEEVYIHNHDDMNPIGRFTTPYPAYRTARSAGPDNADAANDWVFVSYAPWHRLGGRAYEIVLFNLSTRQTIPIYDDPAVSDIDPIPVMPRPRPRVAPERPDPDQETGRILCASVFNTDVPFDKDRVKYVRVIEGLYQPLSINANANFRTRVLGTAPIDDDGSFFVEVPADTPLRFQLLDADFDVVVHETAFNVVRPGETKSCIGCHEPKHVAVTNAHPSAAGRPPARAFRKRGALIYRGTPEDSYSLITRQ